MLAMNRRKQKRDYSTKIPGRSVPEVTGPLEAEMTRQANDLGLKFFGVKLTAEVLTNAIVLHFLSLPQPERDAIVARQSAAFEAIVGLPNHANRAEKPAERGAGEEGPSKPVKRTLPGGGSRPGKSSPGENGDRDVV